MNLKLTRQLGDRPVPPDRRQRHLRLERGVVLLPCPLYVLLLRSRAFLGAGLYLSQLSHFRGPAHFTRPELEAHETAYWTTRTSVRLLFGSGPIISFIVGIMVVYQILAT